MTARVAHERANVVSHRLALGGHLFGRVLRTAAGASVLLMSAPCWAGEPARFDLEYTAEAPCPDRQAFEQLVQTQLAEAGGASPAIPARASVEFRRSAAGMIGRFDLVRRGGSRSSRELESASCDEAATALAFVLALALSGRTAPDVDSSPSQPAKAPQLVATPSAPAADRQRPGTDPDQAQISSSWRWRFGLGVQLGARPGVGPSFTPVEAAVIALSGKHPRSWNLGVRIGFLRGQPITHSAVAGDSTFKWLAGRVEGCFWSAALSRALSVTPCISTHVGQLTVVGTPEPLPGARGRRAAGLWLEAGGALRLELQVVNGLSLEMQGEALAPVTRYQFAFDRPDTNVYRVPALAAYGCFGLVAHFP